MTLMLLVALGTDRAAEPEAVPTAAETAPAGAVPVGPEAAEPAPAYVLPLADGPATGERLAQALSTYIRIPTVRPAGPEDFATLPDGTYVWEDFLIQSWLDPLGLPHERLAGGALAIRVDTPDERPPVLWLSHADVVPVDPNDLDDWTHPPFDGVVADGVVYGRGAIDNKAATVMQLEALREILQAGRTPSRDLVLVVTPDEEVLGEGARAVAEQHLPALGDPRVVFDEGALVLPDFLPGLVVAAVATAEKGFLTLNLAVRGEGGHSSTPREGAPIDVLVSALARVAAWQTPTQIHPVMEEALKRLGAASSFPNSFVMGHPRLFEGVLVGIFGKTPAGNAITRDTVALTILQAGVKDNVIPGEAHATINVRLLPGSDPEAFIADLKAVLADDRVTVTPVELPRGGRVGSHTTPEFRALEAAILAELPEAVVMPTVTPGTTDSRHFAAAGLDTYRFLPIVVDGAGRASIHGNDERLAVAELERGVRIYRRLAESL